MTIASRSPPSMHRPAKSLLRRLHADELESTLARSKPAELLLPQSWEDEEVAGSGDASRTYCAPTGCSMHDMRRGRAATPLSACISLDGFGFQPSDDRR